MNIRAYGSALVATGALALAASDAVAVDIETILLEGDIVPGVGTVSSIDNLAVNDGGSTVIEANTDAATDIDSVLLLDGVVILQEGQALDAPVGGFLGSFDAVNLNNDGNSGWNFFLDGTGGLFDDSGLYFGDNLLVQESEFSIAPELSPDTPYVGFFEAKINNLDEVLVMASIDDAAIESSVDRALIVFEVDANGNRVAERAVVKEGDVLPGQTEAVTDFDTGPHNFDFNDSGTVMFMADLTGDTDRNAAIYVGDTLVAQEGDPSPVAGRNWFNVTSPELSLANDGNFVFSASLDGDSSSNSLIVLNGAKFRQEGDTLPAIAPFLLTSFGTGPVLVGEGGDVLWFGDWDDPDSDVDTGLFYNDELIVQEGVTVIGGLLVDNLRGIQDGYALSDDGTKVLFEAELEGGIQGVFLIDMGGLTLADPDPGQAGVANDFSVSGAGAGATVALVAGLVSGATPVPGCPGLDVAMSDVNTVGQVTADANGDAVITAVVPGQVSGLTAILQAVDRTNCSVSDPVSFTFQ